MRLRVRLLTALALSASAALHTSGASFAAIVPTDFADQPIYFGLNQAVNFDFFPDGRVIVVERATARLRLIVNGAISPVDPVGTVPDVQTMSPEQGLLGVAVDPGWPTKPYVYVYFTANSSPNGRVSRYELDGDRAFTGAGDLTLNLDSRRDILSDLPDDLGLHNGGTLLFGPEGFLYLSLGEDGVPCAAQDIHQLRGKILRMNLTNVPPGPGPTPNYATLTPTDNPWHDDWDPRARLVWHRGLRNPFSYDLDRYTGAMAIADVGSADYEEMSYVEGGGHNFGWPLYEGPLRYDFPCSYADTGTITPPQYWYQRSSPELEASIIMGGIYHRPQNQPLGFPGEYEGNIFILDFYEGWLRRLVPTGASYSIAPLVDGQPTLNSWGTGFLFPTRMRIGPDGGLWYLVNNEMRRIQYTGKLVTSGDPVAAASLSMRVFPVPARGPVTLAFELPAAGAYEARVVDVRGRNVRRIAAATAAAPGAQRALWDGRAEGGDAAPPGVYYAVVEQAGRREVRRLVLLSAP